MGIQSNLLAVELLPFYGEEHRSRYHTAQLCSSQSHTQLSQRAGILKVHWP